MFDLFKKEVHAEMFLMISAYLKQLEDFKETRLCKPEVFTKTTSRKIAPFKVVYELMFR